MHPQGSRAGTECRRRPVVVRVPPNCVTSCPTARASSVTGLTVSGSGVCRNPPVEPPPPGAGSSPVGGVVVGGVVVGDGCPPPGAGAATTLSVDLGRLAVVALSALLHLPGTVGAREHEPRARRHARRHRDVAATRAALAAPQRLCLDRPAQRDVLLAAPLVVRQPEAERRLAGAAAARIADDRPQPQGTAGRDACGLDRDGVDAQVGTGARRRRGRGARERQCSCEQQSEPRGCPCRPSVPSVHWTNKYPNRAFLASYEVRSRTTRPVLNGSGRLGLPGGRVQPRAF